MEMISLVTLPAGPGQEAAQCCPWLESVYRQQVMGGLRLPFIVIKPPCRGLLSLRQTARAGNRRPTIDHAPEQSADGMPYRQLFAAICHN